MYKVPTNKQLSKSKQTINLKMTTNCTLSLPPKYAPYMKEEDICRHCYRASLFKGIIDVKCVCCARPADDEDDCLMPMLECCCVDCRINNTTQDTRVEEDDVCPFRELGCECVDCRINNNTQDTRVEEDDDKEVRDILLLYPNYSGSKEWSYISKKDQLWLSSRKVST
jgi:hypothetical protein